MKKIVITLLCTLCLVCGFVVNYVSAEELTSETVVNIKDIDEYNIMGGGTVYKKSADTYYNGNLDPSTYGSQPLFGLKPQTYQWVDMENCSDEIKTVVWSVGKAGSFDATLTTAIARDYEEKHPGWIVVSGLSGDWFEINDTQEAINLMVQDGEVLKPYSFVDDPSLTTLGWKENGEVVVGDATFDQHMSAHIYTDLKTYKANYKNELSDLNVTAYNTTPSETGITVYTKDAVDSYDLTGYTVYVGQYDLCRCESYTYKPFVKGSIVKIVNDLGVTKPMDLRGSEYVREFYLVCKDGSLDSLQVGNYVKCQFDLNGEWTDVAYSCGFINQVLKDGVSLWGNATGTYGYYDEKTACKPRGVIGFKADGSTVIMDIDGRDEVNGHTGVSGYEAGELMRLAGCVNAYNLDGGGSATLIVRNDYDDFDIVNIPSDGSERQIGNAILFVMRDPGITWDIKNTTRNQVSFKIEETEFSSLVQDFTVTIDGNKSELVNGKYVVSGLKEDTEYVAEISYKIPSHVDGTTLTEVKYVVDVKTKAFKIPSSGVQFTNINKNSVTVIKQNSDTASWISNVIIDMGGTEYILGSNSELLINDLVEETLYEAHITYDVTDPETGNIYKGSETLSFTTLNHQIPTIDKFEIARQTANRITFSYSYSDEDKLVKNAYIYCNKESYKLSTKSGTHTINDLDFDNNSYSFYLLLEYDNGSATLKKIKSDVIEISSTVVKYMINYDLDGGVLPSDAPSGYEENVGLAKLPTPTKEGYKFTGWTLNGEAVTKISSSQTGDITLVATWEVIESSDDSGSSSSGCSMTSIKMLLTLTATLGLMVVALRKKK